MARDPRRSSRIKTRNGCRRAQRAKTETASGMEGLLPCANPLEVWTAHGDPDGKPERYTS